MDKSDDVMKAQAEETADTTSRREEVLRQRREVHDSDVDGYHARYEAAMAALSAEQRDELEQLRKAYAAEASRIYRVHVSRLPGAHLRAFYDRVARPAGRRPMLVVPGTQQRLDWLQLYINDWDTYRRDYVEQHDAHVVDYRAWWRQKRMAAE